MLVVTGLSSSLPVNEISSIVEGRILNLKHISAHFRRCQMLWPVWAKACYTLATLENTSRKFVSPNNSS